MRSSPALQRYPSPLRYPGGKGKVANFLKLLILENKIDGCSYVEPYAGGASVALSLLYEEYVSDIHINDLNRGVYAFWKLATDNPDRLCNLIEAADLTMDGWRHQKAIYSDPSATLEAVGFATFFLNRTNRSGIIARGGVIGGNDQTGRWKIDARFDRRRLIDRIAKLSRFSHRITLSSLDGAALLQTYESDQSSLLYLDPPYYLKGSQLYDNHYLHKDHAKVRDRVERLSCNWIVSYDAASEILDLYRGHQALTYVLGYSASKESSGHEAMFFSDSLSIPNVPSPANISNTVVRTRLRGSYNLFD